ncbi:hypothetical protein SARC_01504 [Sphaeroforma arctica JP610]|uniref:Homeobox domain-containing protein n=1 Tax=Sphaeroforma arctica JP610 TaxID=667725 RepID=A0A0L0GBG6_9EUKA|nr:hypothetical protein SARC_01504 [Sphaeroforma arctica JP610]KNC86345.1 hypothetical protein SARC_01504 [Sphaeroforma arctica JP610]|eukprot:XP_014160247.1 hypothetical protein SARC_01504 [Sphaeroforma arctica JP610]
MDEILLWLDTTLNIDPKILQDGAIPANGGADHMARQLQAIRRDRAALEREYNSLLTALRMRDAIESCEQNITEQLLRMNFNPHSNGNRKTRETESEEESTSPERREARDVLMTWLFQHTRNPYPTITEKDVFVDKTGLSIKQINYWFINARRRVIPRLQEQGMLPEVTVDDEVSEMDAVNNWYKRPNIDED